MLRDFSNASKQKLLALVDEVEGSKICDFTDWVGDRWLDFSAWIGQLNIKNYLNNINSYHRKVIDKNNTSKKAINKIFENVNFVDKTYQYKINDLEKSLNQWIRYFDSLNEIINPSNGRFNAQYISYKMNSVLDDIIKSEVDYIRKYLNNDSDVDFEYGKKLLNELINKSISDMTDDERSLLLEILTNSDMFNKTLVSIDNTAALSNEQTIGLNGIGLRVLSQLALMNYSGKIDSDIQNIENMTKELSGITQNIGEYGEDEGAKLTSSILSYISTLCGIADIKDKSGIDATSYLFSLGKSSLGVEKSIFEYFEETLHPKEAAKLDAKFGKCMIGVSLLADILGTANTGLETYKVFIDSNSTNYDKVAQGLEMGGSIFDSLGDAYIATLASNKSIQIFNKAAGFSKPVNQILSTEIEIKYGTSSSISNKISKASTVFAVGNVLFSTASGGIKRFGEVSADGKVDIVDLSSIGIYGSLSGLDAVSSGLTFGLVHFDSEQVAEELENDVTDFLNEDNWAVNYIRDENNNPFLRFGVSVGSGGYLIGKKVVNGVVDKAKTIGGWISTGWNYATNYIK